MTCEIVGRITCPICGENLQDLRVNRNNNLFMFCDNQCKFTMSGKASKNILPQLRAGKNVNFGRIGIITSINAKNERLENGNGIRINGRTDRTIEHSEPTANNNGGSWLRGFLSADDDE